MSDYLDPNNEELLKDFFTEAQLMVETLEANVLVLENEPGNKESVDEIFRAAHTLKGSAATVQMTELTNFTHLVEDVLDDIRSGSVHVEEPVIDALLESIDLIKAMLDAKMQGKPVPKDAKALTERLHSFRPGEGAKKKRPAQSAGPKASRPAPRPAAPTAEAAARRLSEYELLELKEAAPPGEKIYAMRVGFNADNPMNSVGGIQVFAALKRIGTVLKTVPDFDKLYEDTFYPIVEYYVASSAEIEKLRGAAAISDVTTSIEIGEAGAAESAQDKPPEASAQREEAKAPAHATTAGIGREKDDAAPIAPETEKGEEAEHDGHDPKKGLARGSLLRVDSKRIDVLLNLVSEAVINKAAFNQISGQFNDAQNELSNATGIVRERLKVFFTALPGYFEEIQKGRPAKDVRREIMESFGDVAAAMDPLDAKFKNVVGKFRNTAQNLGRITTELHERVLQIRMVPISQIFSRFPRLIRDLSKSLGKGVNLVIEGEETELDKSVIEDLLDPLIHCVRNSIDHGIESPEQRRALGKPPEGRLLLHAHNEGNIIVIEIQDDGAGIDTEAVQRKAVQRGLIHPNKTLSDIEAFNLIFEAGFSTAQKITDISGRGVGLDVVKRQIEKLNGQVSVWSKRGVGTRLTIKLPLTLAIIQGLLIRVGSETYAIPVASVIESHRIQLSQIRMLDNFEVINVREDVISLLRLNRLFKIDTTERGDVSFVVIVGSSDKKIGLMVDSLIGEEDVVIKPLRDRYSNSPGVAGATILGDGKVALILDVGQLLDLGQRRERDERRRRAAIA